MPSEHAKQLEALWQQFRQRWPLEDLHKMKLEQYNAQGNDDSFCYWIESRLEELGSIWGGSAFKFGVYSRKDKTVKEGGAGRGYNDQYGWMTKYGDSPEAAFENVKKEIIKVAEAAAKGDLETVQKANLGEVIRWKLAFLYQDPDDPKVVPMYKLSVLRALLDSPKISAVQAQKRLREMVESKKLASADMFDCAKSFWQEGVEKMARLNLTIDTAKDFLGSYSDWSELAQATSLLVGYQTQDDFPLALKLNEKSVKLILKSGDWEAKALSSTIKRQPNYILSEDLANDFVSKELALADHELVLVTVTTMTELEELCSLYEDPETDSSSVGQITDSLNQILYGPPGTGKTYRTTELAVQIADPDAFNVLKACLSPYERRRLIKAKYDELVSRGRIDFATFHQSFSYEDFVEGIRAETSDDDGSLTYKVAEGVFKRIADLASKTIGGENSLGLAESPTIWKISIGRRDEGDMRNHCINAGEARIGWNDTGDLSVPLDDRDEYEQKYWNSLTSPNHNVLNDFSENMKVGDVLLCFKDQYTIRAIGVVTSEYRFDTNASELGSRYYSHVRDVNWLVKGIGLDVRHLNGGKRMVQKTLYALGRMNWKSLISEVKRQGIHIPGIGSTDESKPSPNHVIIIDEINRGNTARIFGELITLLEPDKRKGGSDERVVTLPYSKEPFTVPSNLYVIGTMNTADKSLAQLDLALRRRFEFIEVMPDASLLEGVSVYGISIQHLLQTINDRIEVLLDRDHLIGHSYFLPLKSAEDESSRIHLLADIFKKRVIPLLQEYFFADWEKIGWVLNDISKPKEFRFVLLGESENKLDQLFSADIAAELIDRRYQINEKAFQAPQAYQGIFLGSYE